MAWRDLDFELYAAWTVLSVHLYEAVLEQGFEGLGSFEQWRRERYAPAT